MMTFKKLTDLVDEAGTWEAAGEMSNCVLEALNDAEDVIDELVAAGEALLKDPHCDEPMREAIKRAKGEK